MEFELEVSRGLADRVTRLKAGLELRIVKHGLDFQKPQQIAGFRCVTLNQRKPGKACRLAGIDFVERVGRQRQRPLHLIKLELAALHAEEPELQGAESSAQAWIGRQHLDEPLGLRQHLRLLPELLGRHEQKTVLSEEAAALRLFNGAEQVFLL